MIPTPVRSVPIWQRSPQPDISKQKQNCHLDRRHHGPAAHPRGCKGPSVQQPLSMEAPPSPLSSRPERSVVEGSAVLRTHLGNVFRQRVVELENLHWAKSNGALQFPHNPTPN